MVQTATEVQRCCADVWGTLSFRSVRCHNKGKWVHEGRPYCSTHYPPNVEAKKGARDAAWQEKRTEEAERHRRRAAMEKLCENYTTEQIECATAIVLSAGD